MQLALDRVTTYVVYATPSHYRKFYARAGNVVILATNVPAPMNIITAEVLVDCPSPLSVSLRETLCHKYHICPTSDCDIELSLFTQYKLYLDVPFIASFSKSDPMPIIICMSINYSCNYALCYIYALLSISYTLILVQ